MRFCFILFGIFCSGALFGQNNWEPGEPYGFPEGKSKIQAAILRADSLKTGRAIFDCMAQRKFKLGMPMQEPMYRPPDTTEISDSEWEKVWNGVVDNWMVWELNCPENPWESATALIGFWYGYGNKKLPVSEGQIRNWAQLIVAQQTGSPYFPIPSGIPKGCIAVPSLATDNPCFISGQFQRFSQQVCKNYPQFCLKPDNGPFANIPFAVADQDLDQEWLDGTLISIQGMAIRELLMASRLLDDSSFQKAAENIGKWCKAEKPMVSVSLLAHQASALATLFEWTKDNYWKAPMNRILFSMLLPQVLQDVNHDGLVDGLEAISFDSLSGVAKLPGRVWDGFGATSWNTALVASTLHQCYLAGKANGDSILILQLKPILSSIFKNLIFEIRQKGTPPPGAGYRDLCLAILDGQYHLSSELDIPEKDWEIAIRILWNSGILRKGGEYALNVAQYVRYFHPERRYATLPNIGSGKN